MNSIIPEKARLLERLKEADFNVPDFIYVPAEDFNNRSFGDLEAFLERQRDCFKVIARSGHPQEEFFKGGTFDSLETYSDVAGVEYARKRIIQLARTRSRLSILRQQRFNKAPEIDLEEMGVIVMPFIDGASVMAKMVGDHWEFGYSRDRIHKVRSEPYITKTPHDTRLLKISQAIQDLLGFRCEIEYIISGEREIFVVQAKDISRVEVLEIMESRRTVKLDGIRRIRKRRNYRERPVFVMDNRSFYIDVISKCEDMVLPSEGTGAGIDYVIETIHGYEAAMEDFALQHERFAVLGLNVRPPSDLYQIANHYLEESPEEQKALSKALNENMYQIDYFLSEADTLIVKDKIGINLCSHDAYGIDTVRYPLWFVYWNEDRDNQVVREFTRLGFKTGDIIGIDVGYEDRPRLFRV
ncbi:MAG: hypothetical protein J7M32_11805 [Deltaproteobacteria bacterium]|nr:hypothetical protein [Deltaproteobacteria bacterium]